jgi:hypothetical protein
MGATGLGSSRDGGVISSSGAGAAVAGLGGSESCTPALQCESTSARIIVHRLFSLRSLIKSSVDRSSECRRRGAPLYGNSGLDEVAINLVLVQELASTLGARLRCMICSLEPFCRFWRGATVLFSIYTDNYKFQARGNGIQPNCAPPRVRTLSAGEPIHHPCVVADTSPEACRPPRVEPSVCSWTERSAAAATVAAFLPQLCSFALCCRPLPSKVLRLKKLGWDRS